MTRVKWRSAVVENQHESIVGTSALVPSYQTAVIFDPRPHQYRVGGRIVPSVTQILEDAGWINSRFYTPGSAQRGRDIHKLAAWLDAHTISAGMIQGTQWQAYLMAWLAFRAVYGLQITAIESIVVDPGLQWAGKLDRLAVVGRRKMRDELHWKDCDLAVWDLKTGRPEKWHALQLEAYRMAQQSTIPRGSMGPLRKFAVYLAADGTYRVREFGEDLSEEWLQIVRRYWLRVGQWPSN